MKRSFLIVSVSVAFLFNQVIGQGLCMKNISDFSFLKGGLNPRSVASADFNNDGKQDIVTANYSSSNISVLLGNGTAGFGAATNITTIPGNNPIWVITADFNNDTKPDIAVSHFSNGYISVLLGNGNGTFAAPVNFSMAASLSKIVAADFNLDGKMDIVAADYYSGAWITFGNGNGTFTGQTQLAPGNGAISVEIGDINNDFNTDIVTISSASTNNVAILTGIGNGTFNAVSNLTIGGQPKSVAIADVDNDGNKDLVFTANGSNSISVLINGGSGTFGIANSYPCGNSPVYAVVVDVNADGKKDVVTANSSNSLSVLLNTGSGAYGTATNYFSSGPQMLITGDFNNDGKNDLVTANYYADNYNILVGNGTGGFTNKTPYYAGGYCSSATCGDFNGDGKLDVVTGGNDGNINILLGAGAGIFGTTASYTAGVQLMGIASGDIDGDSKLDVVVANNNLSLLSVLKGDGSGGFGAATNYTCNPNYYNASSLVLADVNGDNSLDIITLNYIDNGSVMLNNGSGVFGTPIVFSCNGSYYANCLIVEDFNGDGKKDIAVATSNNNVQVLLGDASGSFTLNATYGVGSSPVGIATGDFNGDAKKDIIVTNNSSGNTVSLLLNNGTGFNSAVNFAIGSYLNSVATGDFNGDGKLDAVVGGNSFYILTGNGSGGFTNNYAYNIALSQNFVYPADLNADGKLDVIAFETSGGEIAVLLNAASPSVTAVANNNPICAGDQVTLTGSGASSYTWTNSVQNGTSFSPVNTNTYTVTGFDLSNCSNTGVITVTVNPLPTLTISATSTLVCSGSTETLTASGANTYTWNNSVTNGIAFSPSSNNTYNVMGTDVNNCSNSASIFIQVDVPNIGAQTTASSICKGNPVTLTGSGANSYTWAVGVTDGVAFSPLASNSYTVAGTDSYGCIGTATISVAVNSLPTITPNASVNPVCMGSSTALSGSGAVSYVWTGNITDGQSFVPSGSNSYTVTGTDNNTCTNTAVITVTVNPLPSVTFTTLGFVSPVCDNASIQTLSGGMPVGGSYGGTGVVSNTDFFVPSAVSVGTYTIQYTYTDANNCTNSATNSVQVMSCSTTGIQHYSSTAASVYPNPSTGMVYIKTVTQEAIVELYNSIGQLVLKQNHTSGSSTLNIGDQLVGLYKVVILDANNQSLIYQSTLIKQ